MDSAILLYLRAQSTDHPRLSRRLNSLHNVGGSDGRSRHHTDPPLNVQIIPSAIPEDVTSPASTDAKEAPAMPIFLRKECRPTASVSRSSIALPLDARISVLDNTESRELFLFIFTILFFWGLLSDACNPLPLRHA